MSHAVIIVSGGDAVSPFTTPTLACASGLAAGNTDTYIRERLLTAGYQVFTAPAMNARSAVLDPDPTSFGAFGGQPLVLPAHMTMLSNGDIDNAGEHLARFACYLRDNEEVTDISWVGHSNGGLFATAASRILGETDSGIRIRSMATLGTPWMGTLPLRVAFGEVPESDLKGNEQALTITRFMGERVDEGGDLGLAHQDTYKYLLGDGGWLHAQAGVLDDVPVLLIGGTWLRQDGGDPQVWPFDGLVSEYSALAKGVPSEVIRHRQECSFELMHSIFVADGFQLPWENALTWNPDVLRAVEEHMRSL